MEVVREPVRRRVRWRWIVSGVALIVVGLIGTIVAAITLTVTRTVSNIDPVAEARTPGAAVFDADDETYDVLFVRSRRDSGRESADFECEVTLADGRTIQLDGAVQGVSTDVANVQSIGSFEAVDGRTTVFCEADGGDNRFVVDDESTVGKVSLIVLIGAVVVLLLGTGLLVGGILWKRTERMTA
jgi:hypothetical protein